MEKSKYNPIIKGNGITPAERYLGRICKENFLSLWSYPGIYCDKKTKKEVCDLLVVFGNHVLVFSDKFCKFPSSGNLKLDWNRWFKRAIKKSANQVWGAERVIKKYPLNLFLNQQCTIPFPIDLPEMTNVKFHLIIVVHGVSESIKKYFGGGSGSLIIDSDIKGINSHTKPFCIGDLDPQKTFVHVLDDDFLLTLMSSRDTISDFVTYLDKKENLIKGSMKIFATGEEELLAIYLKNLNKNKEHDFVFPIEDKKVNGVALTEGHWKDFQKNPQRLAQIEEDKISYIWDLLIETFNKYALEGKQHHVSSGGFKDSEKILRFMAREPRYKRRLLGRFLEEILKTTPDNQRRLRVIPPAMAGDPYYVFLLFPLPPKSFSASYEDYRLVRRRFLEACCMVVKLDYTNAKDIIGIATESGLKNMGRSEDACYLDASEWNKKMEEKAKDLKDKLEILKNPSYKSFHVREYPEVGVKKSGIRYWIGKLSKLISGEF